MALYRQQLRDFIHRPNHFRETLLGDAYRELFYAIKDDRTVPADELLNVRTPDLPPCFLTGQGK